jgi:phosphatidylglycerophosphate synthase
MESSRRPLKSRSQPWARALASGLARAHCNPNLISTAGLMFAAAGACCFCGTRITVGKSRGALFVAAVACVQMRLLCNLLDGMVAVEGGMKTRGGDLFNELPDRPADLLFLVGAGIAVHDAALGWAAGAFAILTAYMRAFGASLGKGQDFSGPMAKQQRMFFLTLGGLASAVEVMLNAPLRALPIALWIIVIGGALTSARRVARLWRAV